MKDIANFTELLSTRLSIHFYLVYISHAGRSLTLACLRIQHKVTHSVLLEVITSVEYYVETFGHAWVKKYLDEKYFKHVVTS